MLHESPAERRGHRLSSRGYLLIVTGFTIFSFTAHRHGSAVGPVIGFATAATGIVFAVWGSAMTRKSAFARTSFGLAQRLDVQAFARQINPYEALAQKEKAVQKCVEAGLAHTPGDAWLALIPTEIRVAHGITRRDAEAFHRTLADEIASSPIEAETEVREDTDSDSDSDTDDDDWDEDYDTYVPPAPTVEPSPTPSAEPPASVSTALSGLIKGMGGTA